MSQINKNPRDLKNLIPVDMNTIYDTTFIDDLIADLKENGMLSPIMLSSLGIPIDGYRRLLAAIQLGMQEVPTLTTELEASPENRVTLNQHREKTWLDNRNEYLINFDTFGKKQGKRSEGDIIKYDRFEAIRNRTKNRFRNPQTINDVEWILRNDNGQFPMSWWLLAKNCDVKPIRTLMELSLKEDHKEIYDLVRDLKMNPKAALQQIEYQKRLTDAKSRNFKIPETTENVAQIYDGDPEEALVELEDESVKVIIFEADKYTQTVPVSKKDGDYNVKQSPETFGTKIGTRLKPFINNRLSKYGSAFVGVQDAYINGFSLEIPYNVIRSIERETGLIYKQTLFLSDSSSFSEKKVSHNLPDNITHLLWFVKSTVDTTFNNPLVITNQGGGDDESNQSLVYQVCSNHLNQQSVSGMILTDKHSKKGSKEKIDPSFIIPIYMTTNEKDLVLDLTMKSDVQSAAVLMNRRFKGVAPSKPVFESVTKHMDEVIKNYEVELTKKLFGTPEPKSATRKVKQLS